MHATSRPKGVSGERPLSDTKRVYHFLGARWAEEDLAKSRLKISRFDDLNDPFELLAADLRDRVVRDAFRALRAHMCEKRGLICFSRRWHNPLIWSHYADKHRGICLGFDVPARIALPIRYDTARLVTDIPRLLSGGPDAERLITRLMATKFKDWRYEDEVRVYADLKEADKEGFYFKEFDADLRVEEVIFGPRYQGDTQKITELARVCNPDISLIRARLAFRKFRIVTDERGLAFQTNSESVTL
jgi:hypothetical protein